MRELYHTDDAAPGRLAIAVSPRHIVLVGLPGAGKTTIGRRAAELLGAPFIDLDEAVVRQAGKSVARIFAEDGEVVFRALEKSIAGDVLRGEPGVVATGGGFMMDRGNRANALGAGLVIYLEASPSMAAQRIRGTSGRPLLDGLEAKVEMGRLLSQRESAYLESHERLNTDEQAPDEAAGLVAKLARERGGW